MCYEKTMRWKKPKILKKAVGYSFSKNRKHIVSIVRKILGRKIQVLEELNKID